MVKDIGLILLYLLMRLGDVAWWVLTRATVVAVFVGGISSLSDTSIIGLGWLVKSAKELSHEFWGIEYLAWVASNWLSMVYLGFLIFLISVSRKLNYINQKARENAIFVEMFVSYLGVAFDTPALRRTRKHGWLGTLKREFREVPIKLLDRMLFGKMPFESWEARAVRNGREVSLQSDISAAVKAANKSRFD